MSSVVFISIIFPKSSKLKDYSQVFPCIPHPHTSLTAFVASCISLKPLPQSLSQAASPTLLFRTLFCCHLTAIFLLRFSSARFSAAISQPSFSYTSLPHASLLPSHSHLSRALLFRTFFSCHFWPPLSVTTFGYHFWLPLLTTTFGYQFWLPLSTLANGSPIGNSFLYFFPTTLTRVLTVAFECAYRALSSRVFARQFVCASS